jgi:hypothetical protein
MECDDRIRSKEGLAVCLRDMGNGTSRLFMDDVKSDKQELPINWQHYCFFTFTPELDNEALESMQLTDEEFQNIDAAVVARLLAISGRVK